MERHLKRSPKRVVLLGSTGSVGTQTLDVIRTFPDRFQVLGLAAGRNVDLLSSQIAEFRPYRYYTADGREPVNCADCRPASLIELATLNDVDLVVAAMSGADALEPAIAALRAGIPVALANKELVVMAGEHLRDAAKHGGTEILPVDSEPSAIWQCLRGELQPPRRLIITASGGAFRDRSWDALRSVSPEEALEHPTWQMGRKITIDSSTLFNKALEVIEARWLFEVTREQLDAVIHPQSIVHSMVEFVDHSVMAQLGPTDMRIPIQYALSYPERIEAPVPAMTLEQMANLTFEPVDYERFPSLKLGFEVAAEGGSLGAVLNAANEVAVAAFLEGRIGYLDIYATVARVCEAHSNIAKPDLDQVLAADRWARERAGQS